MSKPDKVAQAQVSQACEEEDCNYLTDQQEFNNRLLRDLKKSNNGKGALDKKQSEALLSRMKQCDEKRDVNIQAMKVSKLMDQNQQCSFKPELISKPKKDKHTEIHERVDQIIKEKNTKLAQRIITEAKMKEEELLEECTFTPKINKDLKGKSKATDIDSWKRKFQDKLFEDYFEKKEELSFTPQISKKSQSIIKSKTPDQKKAKVEDRLFELSKKAKPEESDNLPLKETKKQRPTKRPLEERTEHVERDTNRKVITVDELCNVGGSKNSKSTSNLNSKSMVAGRRENTSAISKSPSRNVTEKENLSARKSRKEEYDQMSPDRDDSVDNEKEKNKMLENLASNTTYDSENLTNVFLNIINNPGRKIPELVGDKCKTKKDGRKYMKIGETKIFYDDNVLSGIINFGMRNKISTN